MTERIIYIAAHNQNYARAVRDVLLSRVSGLTCNASWIDIPASQYGDGGLSDSDRRDIAGSEVEKVKQATGGLVLLAEAKGFNVPGGKHVETGVAISRGHPVYVVGRKENIFHWHGLVTHCAGLYDLIDTLNDPTEQLT